MKYRTIEDLQSLIDNEIEESTELEYKSSFAMEKPNWKEELAKDVSAMANANGGTIIFGVREKEKNKGHSVPGKLLPVSYENMSKDRLSQLLSSNIQPVIDGIEISIIPNDENGGFFIVEIPQSSTAHQNKLSHLYYKRRNATIEIMEDYEIRDVMNRNKFPKIELEFSLVKKIINTTEKKPQNNYGAFGFDHVHTQKIEYELKYCFVNKGRVYAKYINLFIHIPLLLIPDKNRNMENADKLNKYHIIYDDNKTRDIVNYNGIQKEYGPARYDPLLPGVKSDVHSIKLSFEQMESIELAPPFWYSVMADNAPEHRVVVDWKDIKVDEKSKSITKDPTL